MSHCKQTSVQDRQQMPPVDRLDTVPDYSSPANASKHPVAKAFDVFAAAVTPTPSSR